MKKFDFRLVAVVTVEAFEFEDAVAAVDDMLGVQEGADATVTVQELEIYEL